MHPENKPLSACQKVKPTVDVPKYPLSSPNIEKSESDFSVCKHRKVNAIITEDMATEVSIKVVLKRKKTSPRCKIKCCKLILRDGSVIKNVLYDSERDTK